MFKRLIKLNKTFLLAALLQSSTTIIAILAMAYINTLLLSEFPKTWIPYYYLCATAVTVFSAVILIPILAKTNTKPAFYFELVCGLVILIFYFLAQMHLFLVNVVIIFSLLVIAAMFSVISWNAVSSAFDTLSFRNAAKWFIIINALSSAVFGLIIYYLIKSDGHSIVLLCLLFFIVITTSSLYFLKPLTIDLYKEQKQLSPLKYPLYVKLAIFFFLVTMVYTLIDYFFKLQLSNYNADEIARYTALIYITANVLTAVAQLFSVKISDRFGMLGLFLGLPLLTIITLIPVIIYPNLISVSILLLGWQTFYYSYTALGKQVAVNILPIFTARKSRFYTKAFIQPLATVVSAISILFFGYQYQLYPYDVIVLILLAIMIYIGFKIKKDYSKTLFKLIDEKRFYLPFGHIDYNESSIKNNINEFFESSEANQILLGFSLMKKFAIRKLPENINLLIAYDNTAVKLAAIKAIELFGDDACYSLLAKQLSLEKNPFIIWAIIETLFARKPELIKANINSYLVDSRAVYRAAAIIGVVKYGNLPTLSAALLQCDKMIGSDSYEERLWAAKALGHITIGNFDKELRQLIYDSNAQIASEAIHTCEKLHAYHLLPYIVDQIGRPEMNHDLRKSISRIGGVAIPYLVADCKKLNLHKIKPLIRALCAISDDVVEGALIDLITIKNVYFAAELAKQIAIRASHRGVTARLKNIGKKIIYEDLIQLELLAHLVTEAQTNFQCQEVILRKQDHEKCLFYWLAICTNPEQVISLQPLLVSHQDDELIKLKQSQAIEFLDTIITDRTLAKLISTILNSQVKQRFQHKNLTLSDLNDSWLSKVFSFNNQNRKGITMEPIEKVMILRATSIFKKLPAEILLSIAEEFVPQDMAKDEFIFHAQNAANGLYVLVSGEIGLYQKDQLICTVYPKECIGLIGLFDNLIRPLTAKASSEGSYLFLNKEVFERLIDDYPDIMREAIRAIIKQFRSMLEIKYGTQADILDTLI